MSEDTALQNIKSFLEKNTKPQYVFFNKNEQVPTICRRNWGSWFLDSLRSMFEFYSLIRPNGTYITDDNAYLNEFFKVFLFPNCNHFANKLHTIFVRMV